MTDISSHMAPPPTAQVTPAPASLNVGVTNWYYDPSGTIVAVTDIGGNVEIPEGWTLIPGADGERLWHEQQIHQAEMFALAVQRQQDEALQREERRGALLEVLAGMLSEKTGDDVTVEDVAATLGVPAPGAMHHAPIAYAPADGVVPGGSPQGVV